MLGLDRQSYSSTAILIWFIRPKVQWAGTAPAGTSSASTLIFFLQSRKLDLEYVPTAEECDSYIKNIRTYLEEFGLRHLANPLRRPFVWFFKGYKDAMKWVILNYAFLNNL